MKRSEAIRFFRRVFALSCFGLFFIVFCLLIQMKYIVMANTQDSVGRRHETAQHSTDRDRQGQSVVPWGRRRRLWQLY